MFKKVGIIKIIYMLFLSTHKIKTNRCSGLQLRPNRSSSFIANTDKTTAAKTNLFSKAE